MENWDAKHETMGHGDSKESASISRRCSSGVVIATYTPPGADEGDIAQRQTETFYQEFPANLLAAFDFVRTRNAALAASLLFSPVKCE